MYKRKRLATRLLRKISKVIRFILARVKQFWKKNMQTTAVITVASTKAHERLVSIENSNSFLKRYDDAGALVIQAGYRPNPSLNAYADDLNPIVTFNGETRWYGSIPCEGAHVRSFEHDKIKTARAHFAAMLRASDHGKELTVVAAHWDISRFQELELALEGQYNTIVNGFNICCNVVKVIPVLEGMGSYHLVKEDLREGNTLLIEIGFATSEIWFLNSNGVVIDGRPQEQISILPLVKAIAEDPIVLKSLAASNATSINLSLLSRALQEPVLGRLSSEQWSAIKQKYTTEFMKSLQGFIITRYGNESQSIVNTILTGGGAALLQSIHPQIKQAFTIPSNPQTASVRGSYLNLV